MKFTRQGCPLNTPCEKLRSADPNYLRGGISEGPSKDVRVAEPSRTNDVGGRLWHRPASLQGLAPGIHIGAICCVAHIVPDSRPISSRGNGIDVISQEFGDQTICARAARITRQAAVDLCEGARPSRCHVCMEDDSN